MLKIAVSLLTLAVVAFGQDCDCVGFAKCVRDGKQDHHADKKQCFESCKASLDVSIRNAIETCKPPKDEAKFSCVMEKACTTRTGDEQGPFGGGKGKRGGRREQGEDGPRPEGADGKRKFGGKGGKGGKHGGKHGGLGRLSDYLTEAQKSSMEAFRACLETNCKREERPEPGQNKDGCRTQFPNCGMDFRKMRSAAEECGIQRPEKREGCECLTRELGINDATACESRRGGGDHPRDQRSVSYAELAEELM